MTPICVASVLADPLLVEPLFAVVPSVGMLPLSGVKTAWVRLCWVRETPYLFPYVGWESIASNVLGSLLLAVFPGFPLQVFPCTPPLFLGYP